MRAPITLFQPLTRLVKITILGRIFAVTIHLGESPPAALRSPAR
jgi:hypothetical protein